MAKRDDKTKFNMELMDVLEQVRQMLLEKNRKYGDSAFNPIRCFSKVDAIEQINVRIDDKLSRLKSGQSDDTEDTELDLIGYLVLKKVAILRIDWPDKYSGVDDEQRDKA